ncbi:amino acid ABC transporter substrate-binding protein [Aciduricibacillus chroicocephali]|uniref:Amino acid ABC transporter substrate-binding protein n=1 Tax=Aciduricibacillus chroicocephali TaxID=3054939 RepID=A0ABY9KXJ0_9BACI|nr:amino acid ABC transporter substrate-binding protein [Bacillaceae bacterium 44XB]
MKKLLSILSLLIVSAIVLSACGNKDESKGNQSSKKEDELYNKVKKEGILKIGTEGTYAPFTFHDKSGNLTGFDVEIAEEVAKRLGVKPKFMETQWDGMFAGLDAKRFDMVANEVTIDKDREKKYDFSDPYIQSGRVLIVNKENKDIKKFEDLKGKKSAETLGSDHFKIAKSYGSDVQSVEGFAQAAELVNQKRVAAAVNDKISFLEYTKKHPNASLKVVAEADNPAKMGLQFRKGNDKLVEEVNKALKDMHKDGTYKKISNKWFGEDVSPK